ncbi:hypothetical protein YC2023_124029 [Brassica napus]
MKSSAGKSSKATTLTIPLFSHNHTIGLNGFLNPLSLSKGQYRSFSLIPPYKRNVYWFMLSNFSVLPNVKIDCRYQSLGWSNSHNFMDYVWMDRFELYRRQNHELTKRMWMSFRIEKNKVKNAKPAWKNEKCYINSWWFLITGSLPKEKDHSSQIMIVCKEHKSSIDFLALIPDELATSSPSSDSSLRPPSARKAIPEFPFYQQNWFIALLFLMALGFFCLALFL